MFLFPRRSLQLRRRSCLICQDCRLSPTNHCALPVPAKFHLRRYYSPQACALTSCSEPSVSALCVHRQAGLVRRCPAQAQGTAPAQRRRPWRDLAAAERAVSPFLSSPTGLRRGCLESATASVSLLQSGPVLSPKPTLQPGLPVGCPPTSSVCQSHCPHVRLCSSSQLPQSGGLFRPAFAFFRDPRTCIHVLPGPKFSELLPVSQSPHRRPPIKRPCSVATFALSNYFHTPGRPTIVRWAAAFSTAIAFTGSIASTFIR